MNTERMAEPREKRITGREPLLERPRLKEGYPFPDINSYVVALKNRLHIPEEKFQELRHTRGVKLEGWMSAVQPIEDDRPPVRAKIGSRGVLLSSDIKLPGKITENTPVSQVIQTDALYLAKLKYLREVAPQTTSWGRGRTKEKQIKQQIAELASRSMAAGGKIDRISFKKALVSLDKKKMAPALVTATFALASCTGGPKPIEPSPTEPIVTEVAQVSTVESTATKESPPTPVTIASGRPYPENDTDFFLEAGGPENAEERLRELGAGPDIDKIWAMGVAEMERSGINPENIEWVTELNELAENPSWTTMPRDRSTSHFLFPKITSGSEAGQLVRSGSIFAYLDREIGEDFFDWIELQDPEGVGEVEQRLIGDESGWIVVGAFNAEGEMLFWFNAEEDEWVHASDYAPEVPYKVEEGTVMEWRDGKWREANLPEGVGEIALVEQHEGSWYGINNYDRAVVRLNETEEWEEFVRPVKIIAPHQIPSEEIERLSQEEIKPEEEMRILDAEGNVIDFGFLYEKPLENYPSVTYAYFSCLVRGTFEAFEDFRAIILVLEFPLRYERQIVTILAGSLNEPSFNTFTHLYLVPESGTIEDAERTRTSGDEFLRRFGDPLASGSQIVIALDANQQTSDTEAYQRGLRKLTSSLQEGRAVSLDQLFMINEIWADERVFK